MELKVKISDIDYGSAMDFLLPIITKKLSEHQGESIFTKLISDNSELTAAMAKAALVIMPQNIKDEIAVAFFTKYKDELINLLMKFASEKGVSFIINKVEISSAN